MTSLVELLPYYYLIITLLYVHIYCSLLGSTLKREDESPLITKKKWQRYKVGESVKLNCTSVSEDAHLMWFINDKKVIKVIIFYQNFEINLIKVSDKIKSIILFCFKKWRVLDIDDDELAIL